VTDREKHRDDIPKGIDSGPSGFGNDWEIDDNVGEDNVGEDNVGGDNAQQADAMVEPQWWEITVAMLAHLLGAVGVLGGVVGGIVGPMLIWLFYQKDSAYIEHHAREATNFQFTVVMLFALTFLLTGLTCGLLLPKMLIPVILQIVFGTIAAIAAQSGTMYRYPICLRMLKKKGTERFSSMR
jgi:uncharacterized Tic20 family protein